MIKRTTLAANASQPPRDNESKSPTQPRKNNTILALILLFVWLFDPKTNGRQSASNGAKYNAKAFGYSNTLSTRLGSVLLPHHSDRKPYSGKILDDPIQRTYTK